MSEFGQDTAEDAYDKEVERDQLLAELKLLGQRTSSLENSATPPQPSPPESFYAKLTAETDGIYTFEEVYPSAPDTYATVTDGVTGTTAEELNGQIDIPVDSIVIMRQEFIGEAVAWRFDGSISGSTDTSYAMEPTTLDDLGNTSAQEDTFPGSAEATDDSVSFDVARTAWNGTDGTLDRFNRVITIPRSSGITVTAEAKTEIDGAEDCDADVDGGTSW